jgi:hypothetical protein
VICLKRNARIFFKTVIICAWCLAFFLGAGYYYLSKNLKDTEIETPNVPYSQETPQNCGLLFEILGENTFIYLDFENSKATICLYPQDIKKDQNEIYGYSIDYRINADVDFIADLVDSLEGIELNFENQTLRYTGVQVVDLILSDKDFKLKLQIIKAIAQKIANAGISKEMLLYIVENCDTNLTVPDFYYWPEYIGKICAALHIIDG